jgi:putative membrane protein
VNTENQSTKDTIFLLVKGFVMGSADVVPGVSGGTMALILGIYERLINSIRCINSRTIGLLLRFKLRLFLEEVPWRFLVSVGAGILLAVFTLAGPIEYLLENYEIYVWSFFFGLILASIFVVKKRIRRFPIPILISIFIGVVIGYTVAGLVPAQTPNTLPFIFVSGVIAICAMILPGISGSFLLVVLGKYEQILHAVNQREFTTLIVFALGAGIGLLLFAKLLSYLLKNYHDTTMAILIGLMIGSLRKIWPWRTEQGLFFPTELSKETLYTVGLLVVGIGVVTAIESFTKIRKKISN